jgi:energy-coupling factor transporter ATP-binding protein EcfA2
LETRFPVETRLIFKRRLGEVRAVDGVRLSIKQGEVLGVVGESGCGKSTLGRTIVQLIPPTSGTVILEGRNLNQFHGPYMIEACKAEVPPLIELGRKSFCRVHPRSGNQRPVGEAVGFPWDADSVAYSPLVETVSPCFRLREQG